ncbi:DNA polymerase alpha/delta/epsilon, subunit B [Dillenia turbinata]|uniref:DNA polymerase alpha subunit B n=1 Tax=Dillenia turbinata TaxID=194707 RepID=A0AAN8UUR2_9MAGN
MEEEIKAAFFKSNFSIDDEGQVLQKCVTFCINFKLSPSDLVSSWEVYFLNRQWDEQKVQNAQMEGFLLHLQNEQKEAAIKEEMHLHMYSSNDVDMILNDEYEDRDGIHLTPTKKSEDLISEENGSTAQANGYSVSVEKHSSHPNTEDMIKEHYPEDLEEDIIRRVKPSRGCSLQVHRSQPEPGCRFMYDRTEDRFNYLESRIKTYGTALLNSGLYEDPADPSVASQKSVFAVGMICCEAEGQINEKSVLLQSSVEHSGGQCVRLDLKNLSQYSIFPGQVVGIEGHNPSGHCMIASKLVDSIPLSISTNLDLHPAKKQTMDPEFQPTDSSSVLAELSMIAAAGPFTTTDNLMFEPLTGLLSYARRKPPQLLMLVRIMLDLPSCIHAGFTESEVAFWQLGPFVDSEHPEIKKGSVDRSFDDIFHLEILTRLQDYVEYMGPAARVVLIPSVRDTNHDVVFPQPAFDPHSPDLKRQITSLSNPAFFGANEVKVGCCSIDILKQLSGEEFSGRPADGTANDRMSRLARHIIGQRSFYPLYPPSEEVPLDFLLAPEAVQIPSIPEILILPSDLAPFVKVLRLNNRTYRSMDLLIVTRTANGLMDLFQLDIRFQIYLSSFILFNNFRLSFVPRSEEEEEVKCICVNPGRLAKGVGGGNFAEINYCSTPDATSASIIRI